MKITLLEEGTRVYLVGNTYPLKEILYSVGCRLDLTRKMMWIGLERKYLVEGILKSHPSTKLPEDKKFARGTAIAGEGKYKGRTYYIAGTAIKGLIPAEDRVVLLQSNNGSRLLLCSKDDVFSFWAEREKVQIIKSYKKPIYVETSKKVTKNARVKPKACNYLVFKEAV